MKRFNIKWHTHNNTAGGMGTIEAVDEDGAIEGVRQFVIDHNPLLTEEEIEKLVIEVEEA